MAESELSQATSTGFLPASEDIVPLMRKDTRVDGPHLMGDPVNEKPIEVEPLSDVGIDLEGHSPLVALEQLRLQGEQLGAYLRLRQQELDHRESTLNSQEADLENQFRTSRMWLVEQQEQLVIREETMRRQAEDFAEREQHWQQRIVELEREVEARQTAEPLQAEVDRLQQRVDELEQALSQREEADSLRVQIQGQEQAAQFELRCAQLDEAEQRLTDAHRQFDKERSAWTAQRHREEEQLASQQALLTETRRNLDLDLVRQKQAIVRRGESLDAREAALDQMRDNLSRLHRETLEMRLATEETWSRLCGAKSSASLTQSMGQIRHRLAEQFRQDLQELVDQKQQLRSLAAEIDGQHEKLNARRCQLDQWLTIRQQEIEQQATRLVAREQELDHQEAEWQQKELDWQSERRRYQQDIRRLLVNLGRAEEPSTVAGR